MLWCGIFTVALTTAPGAPDLAAAGRPVPRGARLAGRGSASGCSSRTSGPRAPGFPEVMRTRAVFSFWRCGSRVPPVRGVPHGAAREPLDPLGDRRDRRRGHGGDLGDDPSAGPRRRGPPPPARGTASSTPCAVPGVPLLIVALVLLMAANSASVSALPLLVTQQLGLDIIWSGIALGVAAGLEIPVLLVLGRVASRYGQRRPHRRRVPRGLRLPHRDDASAPDRCCSLAAQPLNAVSRRDGDGPRADPRAGRRRPSGPGVRAVHEHHPRRLHHRRPRAGRRRHCVDRATAGSSPSAAALVVVGLGMLVLERASLTRSRARRATLAGRPLGDAAQPGHVGLPPRLVDVGQVGHAGAQPARPVELLAQDVEVARRAGPSRRPCARAGCAGRSRVAPPRHGCPGRRAAAARSSRRRTP